MTRPAAFPSVPVSLGDILTAPSGIVVQGCNARGVMGSGLAAHIASVFPEVKDAYLAHHKAQGLRLGDVVWVAPTARRPFWVANAITQENFGRVKGERYASPEAIAQAFRTIADRARRDHLTVHYPLIGAGLGGLAWEEVAPIVARELSDCVGRVWVLPNDPHAAALLAAAPQDNGLPNPPPPTGRWRRR